MNAVIRHSILTVIIFSLFSALQLRAATITVTTDVDDGSAGNCELREAIEVFGNIFTQIIDRITTLLEYCGNAYSDPLGVPIEALADRDIVFRDDIPDSFTSSFRLWCLVSRLITYRMGTMHEIDPGTVSPGQSDATLLHLVAKNTYLDATKTLSLLSIANLATGPGDPEQADLDGWWVPRRNYIFGKWIRHAGWYPDYQLRLLRRERARYDERREVHELVNLDGEADHLRSPLIHYNYDTVQEFREKQGRYTDYEVRMLLDSGKRARPWNFVLQPLRQFRWRYILLDGYRDGWRGLLLSLLMAYYELVRYWRLWHLQRT